MGILLKLNNYFFIGALIILFLLFYYQIYKFDKLNKEKCLDIFKSNNLLGLLTLVNIIIGKI